MRSYCWAALLCAVIPAFSATASPPVPVLFIPNQGQADLAFRFVVQTPDVIAGFGSGGATFQFEGHRLEVRYPGSTSGVVPTGVGQQPGLANFLRATSKITGLPLFNGIRYTNLYPGIDLSYGAAGTRVKSEFLVKPHADPGLIRLEYPQATVSLSPDGALLVEAEGNILRDEPPVIYQTGPTGQRVGVAGRYRLVDAHTAGFEADEYDADLPLIIDPVISYSSYLGGSGMGAVTGVAVDSNGILFATGWTEALNFPINSAYQAVNHGGVDVFVVKVSPTGAGLIYATYIGGSGDDRAAGIAVSSTGEAYIAGGTGSADFPIAATGTTLKGARDAFVLRLNSAGSALIYSTYLGGTNWDQATAIALDSSGNAYVAGDTQSTNMTVLSAAQSSLGGSMDAFLTKLNSIGTRVYSTYLGGSGNEHAGGVAVNAAGNAFVAGGTTSTNFPVLGALQPSNGGGQDAFITKLSTTGSTFAYSTYLGGNGGAGGFGEQANAIQVDSSGAVYITGETSSSNFPVTAGTFQSTFNGVQDGFVSKLNAAGSSLVYSTYLGGSSFDWATGLAVDSAGSAHVTGYTASFGFPSTSAVQTGFNGQYDAFVTKLNAAGNAALFSTYYGGAGADLANAIALDASGNMYLGGQTASTNFPLTGAIQSNNIGGSTGWIAKFGVTAPPPTQPSVVSVSPASGSGNTVTLTAVFSHPSGGTTLTTGAILVSSSASSAFGCQITYNRASNLFSLADDAGTSGSTVIPGGGDAQNTQCTVKGQSSSASVSGNNLTITVALVFLPGFSGAKTVYLSASDASVNTGWVAKGTWTVTLPPPVPSADSVSPNANAGGGQTFTFVFSDTQSAMNLTAMAILFKDSVTFTNACYVVYDRNTGTVALVWDSAAGSDSKPLSSSTVLQNSQCQVGAVTSNLSGLSLTMSVAITFKGAFGGAKNIYMFGSEGPLNTGWVQRGTYTVTAGGAPVATSVVPSTGVGPSQRFSFTATDPGGSNYITGIVMLIASSLNQNNACNMVYDRNVNKISLAYDIPSNGATPVVPGSNTNASNAQCTLRGANSTVVIGATSVVVTVDILFNANFSGTKSAFLFVQEVGANSGWGTVGSWTVTGGAPTADSVSPASGSGFSPNFLFTVSDSTTQANISGMSMLITTGSPANTANACYLIYNRTNATIGLYNNAGTVLSTKGIGSSTTLQNSQCAVGYTVMTASGTSVVFTINVVFTSPAFSGAKSVYLMATEPASNSGWVLRGTWTIP